MDTRYRKGLPAMSEARSHHVSTHGPAVVYSFDPCSDKVTFVAENIKKQLGHDPQSFMDDPKLWARCVHPEDLPRLMSKLPGLLEEGRLEREYRFRHRDGSYRWIYDELVLVRDHNGAPREVMGRFMDITERKGVEESLRGAPEDSERYRMNLDAILHSIADGILSVDANMCVIYANKALGALCPSLRKVHVGMSLKDVPWSCDGACHAALVQILKTKEPIFEYRVKCGSGAKPKQSVVLNGSQLFDNADELEGAVLIIRDITRLEELERKSIERHSFGNIIGKSKRMQEIYRLLESLAEMETTVLVTGESGTGKELIAEALHYGGKWSSGPLVKVNCSALPENLLESELFGHVRGAFTGAISDRTGRFHSAEGGTIFLDEIGDISPLTQLKLLRVLERKEFERVGESRTNKVSLRIIVATNADLQERVKRGLFREDLYYRLKVMVIHLPPLRERTDDIPLLTDHFIRQIRNSCSKNITGASDDVLELFMSYQWRGNVRELMYSLEHACILCPGGVIAMEHLPGDLKESIGDGFSSRGQRSHADLNAADILEALEKAEGKKARAARLLGISRKTLYRRIEKYGIKDK